MRSFTARITLQFAALVTATTALVLLAGGWLQSREAVKGLDFLNQAEFAEVSQRLGPNPHGLRPADLARLLTDHAEIDAAQYLFQVRNTADELLFRSRNLGRAILPDRGDHEVRRSFSLPGIGRVRATEFVTGDLHVQVASPLAPAERLLRDYARTSFLLLALVALASVGLGWYFARLTLRPVRAIRETASRIGPETLGERIPLPEGRDELTALAGLLNRMFDRLEASFAQVQRFTADASHELKTPLSLLRLNAEKLREKTAGDREAAELLDEMLEDLDAVRRMIDSLLFLAKAESGSFVPARAEMAADEFVKNFAEDALAMAEDRGAVFAVERCDAGAVRCEPTLLRQVLLNLVDNALRVTAPGGRITLQSTVAGDAWRLTVADEGPGVPDAQLERIFERFVRFDRGDELVERPRGHGLGLAICRSIAALHGGRIFARNRPDRSGLEVTVELPRVAESRA